MNKKYGKVLLIVIIVFQLAFPITFFTTKMVRKKAVNDYGKDIKVSVQSMYFEDNCVYVSSAALGEIDSCIHKYLTFEERADGFFYTTPTDEKTGDGVYVNAGAYGGWSWHSIPYRNSGIIEDEVYFYTIYDLEMEKENIAKGYVSGPTTEAYMIIRVYKGEFEIKDVYVGGVTLKEYVEKFETGEIDPERFEYMYEDYNDDYYYYDDYDEDVTDYTEEVTEPVVGESA